jgi:hypothetical protein
MNLPEFDSKGNLPAFAWPGGYPIYYLARENSVLCAGCATKALKDEDEMTEFKPVASDVHWEGASLFCEQCNKEIESAYGDPGAEDEDNA